MSHCSVQYHKKLNTWVIPFFDFKLFHLPNSIIKLFRIYFSYNIRSQDDISSGYSSAEPVSGLSRTSSMTNASKARAKSKRNEVGIISVFLFGTILIRLEIGVG